MHGCVLGACMWLCKKRNACKGESNIKDLADSRCAGVLLDLAEQRAQLGVYGSVCGASACWLCVECRLGRCVWLGGCPERVCRCIHCVWMCTVKGAATHRGAA